MEPSPLLLTGKIHICLWGPTMDLKEEWNVDNLVVTTGVNHVADQLDASPAQAKMLYMAIGETGSGLTAPAPTDTDIENEQFRRALEATYPLSSGNQVAYRAIFAPGEGVSNPADSTTYIEEAGIFNNAAAGPASGVMLARGLFGPAIKEAGDSLTIDWTITLQAP